MAKKKVVHKVAYGTAPNMPISKEMFDWLLAHGCNENDKIRYHDPLFVQCVEEVKPKGWMVTEITGNKYRPVDFVNDTFIFTPETLKVINKSWIVIEDEAQEQA